MWDIHNFFGHGGVDTELIESEREEQMSEMRKNKNKMRII